MSGLGKLELVDLREVWPHEERDFSSWLAQEENIELLGDELGIEIEVQQREAPVGNFQVDLLAEEANSGRKIIIENQLEVTNHDHLGKIITYAAGMDAEIIIWIVREIRDEHKRAVEWLNEHTDERVGFFIVKMEVWRIGDSQPAPKFNVVVQPNDWAKAVKKVMNASHLSDTKILQLEFWSSFNEAAQGNTTLRLRKPQPQHWYNFSVGSSKAEMALTVNSSTKEIAVEIYIPNSEKLFECLFSHKGAIEETLGWELDWQPLPGKKASRIKIARTGDFTDKDRWPEYHRWMLETAEAFKKVFGRHIKDCMDIIASVEPEE